MKNINNKIKYKIFNYLTINKYYNIILILFILYMKGDEILSAHQEKYNQLLIKQNEISKSKPEDKNTNAPFSISNFAKALNKLSPKKNIESDDNINHTTENNDNEAKIDHQENNTLFAVPSNDKDGEKYIIDLGGLSSLNNNIQTFEEDEKKIKELEKKQGICQMLLLSGGATIVTTCYIGIIILMLSTELALIGIVLCVAAGVIAIASATLFVVNDKLQQSKREITNKEIYNDIPFHDKTISDDNDINKTKQFLEIVQELLFNSINNNENNHDLTLQILIKELISAGLLKVEKNQNIKIKDIEKAIIDLSKKPENQMNYHEKTILFSVFNYKVMDRHNVSKHEAQDNLKKEPNSTLHKADNPDAISLKSNNTKKNDALITTTKDNSTHTEKITKEVETIQLNPQR